MMKEHLLSASECQLAALRRAGLILSEQAAVFSLAFGLGELAIIAFQISNLRI
jgi:hypothetical protein